ncbi:MAG: hypothetical protein KGJ90_04140 [Patescibacteria group bacterium]|nr:hypothetical protein [Patescibacteria group bacterium]
MASAPGLNVQTTTNQYLAPYWADGVLRDNYFFGRLMQQTKRWDGVWMLFPRLIGELKLALIYGENPNLAFI